MNRNDALSYLDNVYRYAMVLVRTPADAEYLVQETYVRALKSTSGFRPDSNLKTWLLTIVRSTWWNERRSRHCEVSDGGAGTAIAISRDANTRRASDAESTLVRDSINQLSLEDREIIVLREYEELSYRDIATILGCPIGTVTSRLTKAREKLRALLASVTERSASEFVPAIPSSSAQIRGYPC